MRDFATLHRELKLKPFLESPLGALYLSREVPGASRLVVRHFDGSLPSTMVGPFVAMLHSTQQWLERNPELERLVSIEQPVEVGSDFVARKHHIYGVNLSSYTEWDEPPAPPPQLARMQKAFRGSRGKSTDPRDTLLEKVLARSLLEATAKTYFDDDEERFIVVDLKPTADEVKRWAALSAPGTR
ncbi:DUF4604 domain-containing protein [Corallococcus exiguus]|uniref:DUF4604 domain-containing protein n=1 Tax=Corallococcus exiguus TaxID=83462 RepID=UPI0014943346|nr:DUF4604 domain-containing protein [Corallococcus exiguus]NPD23120.1 DUF4604 domain-containing protein [Corallococcus exiguus]NRD47239.1 DUF4604 domain-containing protein [Corallococcus exiguus]